MYHNIAGVREIDATTINKYDTQQVVLLLFYIIYSAVNFLNRTSQLWQ